MISKWWWRYKEESDLLWVSVIRAIPGDRGNTKLIPVKNSSTGSWKDIGKVDAELSNAGIDIREVFKVKLGNGKSTRFWADVWVGNTSLACRFPHVFSLDKNKEGTVADHYGGSGVMSFSGWDWVRSPNSVAEWNEYGSLMGLLNQIKLGDNRDEWSWLNEYGFASFGTAGHP